MGVRWDLGGSQVGVRWESGGSYVGLEWDLGGSQVGVRWESALPPYSCTSTGLFNKPARRLTAILKRFRKLTFEKRIEKKGRENNAKTRK